MRQQHSPKALACNSSDRRLVLCLEGVFSPLNARMLGCKEAEGQITQSSPHPCLPMVNLEQLLSTLSGFARAHSNPTYTLEVLSWHILPSRK